MYGERRKKTSIKHFQNNQIYINGTATACKYGVCAHIYVKCRAADSTIYIYICFYSLFVALSHSLSHLFYVESKKKIKIKL